MTQGDQTLTEEHRANGDIYLNSFFTCKSNSTDVTPALQPCILDLLSHVLPEIKNSQSQSKQDYMKSKTQR